MARGKSGDLQRPQGRAQEQRAPLLNTHGSSLARMRGKQAGHREQRRLGTSNQMPSKRITALAAYRDFVTIGNHFRSKLSPGSPGEGGGAPGLCVRALLPEMNSRETKAPCGPFQLYPFLSRTRFEKHSSGAKGSEHPSS